MRALHWPNAFPAQDVALQKALGTRQQTQAGKATEALANAWQPWRSYAAMCLWQGKATHDADTFQELQS
jgi:AraC family transcriptional regulator of adaptative response / DNA-3-methyladenine glycosylase II